MTLSEFYLNMYSIGSDGWIKYTYNTNPNQLADFSVTLNPVKFATGLDFHTASKNVAEEIANINENIFVAMSGGIDSEHVANTFYNNKIKFTPVIFTCEDLNSLDVWWAYEWCNSRNIIPIVVNYNIDSFVNHLVKNSIRYRCRPLPLPVAVEVLSEVARKQNALLIAGTGDFTYYPDITMSHMKKQNAANFSYDDYRVKEHGYYIHIADLVSGIMNTDMPFNFLSWNPEILYSYIREYDITKDSMTNKARITGCVKRPKNTGYPDYFYRTHPKLGQLYNKMNFRKEKFTEVDYLGTREQVMNLLRGI